MAVRFARWLILLPVAIFLVVSPVTVRSQGEKTVGAGQSRSGCQGCHPKTLPLIRADHPDTTPGTIQACLGCHKPADPAFPKPGPFFSRLHRTHVAERATVKCTLCHAWKGDGAFGLAWDNGAIGYGVLSRADLPLMRSRFTSWSSSPFLDGLHGKADVSCLACHGTMPARGAVAESSRCNACHGYYECLGDRTAPKDFPERNPHSSHLGRPACTDCHKGHRASRAICLDCHREFSMRIPGGDQPR